MRTRLHAVSLIITLTYHLQCIPEANIESALNFKGNLGCFDVIKLSIDWTKMVDLAHRPLFNNLVQS